MRDNTLCNELFGALVGLSRAIDNNPNATDDTYACLAEAAALPEDAPDEDILSQINVVHTEKRRISPDCAVCANPCGRTDDYDLSRIGEYGEEVLSLKLALLEQIQCMAARLQAARRSGAPDRDGENLLCVALFRLGYDESAETLGEFLKDIKR